MNSRMYLLLICKPPATLLLSSILPFMPFANSFMASFGRVFMDHFPPGKQANTGPIPFACTYFRALLPQPVKQTLLF